MLDGGFAVDGHLSGPFSAFFASYLKMAFSS